MYFIRQVKPNEVSDALTLALEVFMQFEAPDYKPQGVETFRKDIIENAEFIDKCRKGICPIYAAFDDGKMVWGLSVCVTNRILTWFSRKASIIARVLQLLSLSFCCRK